ncbi:hypothetical protein P5V93_22770 [Mycobacteroides abscessus subsp. abscessus]|uniref:hypothetical protein n=2 Tax=Mycobacteroides abscessus TaxID=36809 RepID=UPI00089DBBCD|nr:hypothetical protein [Mycobacteroides abscessus]MDB2191097.1 hypothetical protein [Mycobacteroides abscessus subsp. abscessus]MDM2174785.1 hypothetical protein [Mycobacteroides abscessus]MDM2179938.1 hypothetical protein [Mycobacteroides abscessus]MDM2206831.1 hypothetical protein [Mycobacteroides abscessus]MDM2209925.1 hypothetical protein [Mycobacteroides abscessus]
MTPPLQPSSQSQRPPIVHRWWRSMLYKSIGQGIDEWRTFMSEHFELYGGATTMQTARYTVDLLQLVSSLTSAATRLAAHGNPAARTPLADAALALRSALDRLCDARDELLKAAGATRVQYD